jgi:hypothetical protein
VTTNAATVLGFSVSETKGVALNNNEGRNGTAGSTNMKAVFGKFSVADDTGSITATTSYQTGETVSKFSEVAPQNFQYK